VIQRGTDTSSARNLLEGQLLFQVRFQADSIGRGERPMVDKRRNGFFRNYVPLDEEKLALPSFR